MQMENITKILYSRDINKIKELLTYIIKECKLNNKTDIQLGNFKIDLENLNVMYIDIDGCIEYSKFGLYKKTDKIYDVQTFAITSSQNKYYEKDIPLLHTISSIELFNNDTYETHHIEIKNSNMKAIEIIKNLEYIDIDNESKALITKNVNKKDKINYIESYLNHEYLQPVMYNDELNKYELINLQRKDQICEQHIMLYTEEEIIIALIYKIMIEILLND